MTLTIALAQVNLTVDDLPGNAAVVRRARDEAVRLGADLVLFPELWNEHRPDGALGPPGRVIPESSITKPPTAELWPNQTDQDSLPPYAELDAILEALVEDEESVPDVVARGFSRDSVVRIQRLLYSAEYKRRQAPPGVKITRKSFGGDRRYPLTNGFREA